MIDLTHAEQKHRHAEAMRHPDRWELVRVFWSPGRHTIPFDWYVHTADDGFKIAMNVPRIPDYGHWKAMEAIKARRLSGLTGRCPCGAVSGLVKPDQPKFDGAGGVNRFHHEDDCPAYDDNFTPIILQHGRTCRWRGLRRGEQYVVDDNGVLVHAESSGTTA